MLLKNKSARLITINGPLNEKGERTAKYQIKPGKNPAVEVPNGYCKSDFVKSLIDSGSLVAQSGSVEALADPTKPDLPKPKSMSVDEDESIYTDFDKAQLVVQCEERGIEVSSRDTKATLIAKLEA